MSEPLSLSVPLVAAVFVVVVRRSRKLMRSGRATMGEVHANNNKLIVPPRDYCSKTLIMYR